MRLTEAERIAIRSSVTALDPSARVYLFGSRARDDLKGGDIDLLVVSEKLGFSDKITLLTAIKSRIGEQKVDILIKKSAELTSDPFVASVLAQAREIV